MKKLLIKSLLLSFVYKSENRLTADFIQLIEIEISMKIVSNRRFLYDKGLQKAIQHH